MQFLEQAGTRGATPAITIPLNSQASSHLRICTCDLWQAAVTAGVASNARVQDEQVEGQLRQPGGLQLLESGRHVACLVHLHAPRLRGGKHKETQ